ncbi:MAG: mechanosensitive ion channel family protein [Chitinophagales bacterium]
MNDFWNQIILNNPVKRYFFVGIAILIGLLFKRVLSRFIGSLLHSMVKKMTPRVDRASFLNLVTTPLEIFLILLITIISLEKLNFPDFLNFDIYEINFKTILQAFTKILVIASFFWLVLRIIDFVAMVLEWKANATPDIRDNQLIIFFRDFIKVVVSIIGVMTILSRAFHFELGSAWTGLGIAGAAIALSTKESIENLIASFIIFFDKPFTPGDVLKVNNITGTVEKIGLRSTRIRTELKTYVTVPNKQMVDSIVDNQTLRTQRKAELRLQIALSTPTVKVIKFIKGIEVILNRDIIENPSVFLNDIAGNAFSINADYFTAPIPLQEFNQLKQQVNLAILELMEQLGIEIAGATTDIEIVRSETPAPGSVTKTSLPQA